MTAMCAQIYNCKWCALIYGKPFLKKGLCTKYNVSVVGYVIA